MNKIKILEVGTPEYGNDIEFKSSFDEIEFYIAMKMYMKHNSKIASINEHLGEMYNYKDLEEAKALEEYDTLQEYKKALKEKCDAFDKATKEVKELYEMAKEQDSDNVNLIDRLEIILNILKGDRND